MDNKSYNKIGIILLTIIISIIIFITPLGVLVGIYLFSLEYKENKKDKIKKNDNKSDDAKLYKKFCLIFFPIVVLFVLFFTPLGAMLFMILITLGYSILYTIPEAWLIIPLILITYKSIKYLIRLYKTNIKVEELPYQDRPKVTQIYKHLIKNKKVVIVSIFLTFICLTPTIYNDLSFSTWGNTLTLYRNIFDPNVVVPKKITTIGESAFKSNVSYSINNIYSIDMTNVEKISQNAFLNQERLTQVNFSDNLEIIGENAFAFCGLEEINLPNSLKIIEDRAFFNNRFKNVTIPSSVTYIGKGAFGGFYAYLQTITIPDSVEYISDDLFTTLHDYDNRVKTMNEMFIPEESPLVLVKQDSYAESVCIKNGWNFDYY